MNGKLISLSVKGIRNYEEGEFKIDFFNHQKAAKKYGELDNIFSSFYLHTLVSVVGQNASGKTMTLRLINWCMKFFLDNEVTIKDLKRIASFKDDIEIQAIFYNNSTTQTLSKIILVANQMKSENPRISDEKVYFNVVNNRTSKKEAFNFDENAYINRTRLEKIMSENTFDINDKRVQKFELNPSESMSKYFRFINGSQSRFIGCMTNNVLNSDSLNNVPPEIYTYLDSSIERFIEYKSDSEEKMYELKFIDRDSIIGTLAHVSSYLSSGTLRGMAIFSEVIKALKNGGYLLIDEIELSLHKALVIDIIKLFYQRNTNPNKAILLFSTHYSETLDVIRRNDSVYVCNKSINGLLSISNLSTLLSRNDENKTDSYLNGLMKVPTLPSYESYQKFLRKVIEETSMSISKKK